MERKLTITRSESEFCHCNSCSKNNYDRNANGERESMECYELRIGSMLNTLCADCLWELVVAAQNELAK